MAAAVCTRHPSPGANSTRDCHTPQRDNTLSIHTNSRSHHPKRSEVRSRRVGRRFLPHVSVLARWHEFVSLGSPVVRALEAPATVPRPRRPHREDPEPIRLGAVCLNLIRAPLESLRRDLHIRSRTCERKASAIGAELHCDGFARRSHERAVLLWRPNGSPGMLPPVKQRCFERCVTGGKLVFYFLPRMGQGSIMLSAQNKSSSPSGAELTFPAFHQWREIQSNLALLVATSQPSLRDGEYGRSGIQNNAFPN